MKSKQPILGSFFVLLSLTLFVHCGPKQRLQSSHNSGHEIVLSKISKESLYSMIDTMSFLSLETTDKSLIRSIAQLDAMGDYLYILNDDFASVLIYDRNGKFINSINDQGRGPNEYIRIGGMFLNRMNRQIVLSDAFSKRLLIYDWQGKFQKVIPLDICQGLVVPFSSDQFVHLNDGIEDMLSKEMRPYNLTIINNTGVIEQSLLADQTPNPLCIDTRNNVQCMEDGTLLFSPLLSNKIYQIKADSIITRYYFTSNLGGYKMFESNDLKTVKHKVEDVESKWVDFENRGYLSFMGTCMEDSTWLFTTIGLRKYRFFVFVDKNTYQATVFDCTTPDTVDPAKMSVEEALTLVFASPPLHIEDSFVYIQFNHIHKAFLEGKSIDKQFRAICDALGDNENPLIVRYKIKSGTKD